MEGGFTLSQRLWIANLPLYESGSFGIGDLNGDGHLDLVFPNSGEAGVVVYLGNGSGRMGAWTEYPTGSGPISVTLADFNHDGRLDVVTSNWTARNLSILLGTATGILGPKSDFTTGQSPSYPSFPGDLESGDLNGDGLPDLIVGSNSPLLTPLIGKGDGTFEVGVAPPSSGRTFRLGDVNRDGHIDLIRAGSVVSIELGLGDGTFEPPVDLPRSGRWDFTGIALGDLNGDGILDIAAVAPGSDYDAFPPPNRQVSIYIGAGNVSFPQETLVSTAGAPASIAIGDLNGDNLDDMAVSNVAAQVVSLHFGNGNGTFGNVRNYPTGAEPWSVQAADFNGDGYADVTTANHGAGTVSVLLGEGGGDLAPKVDYPAGAGPFYLVTGHVNQDDHPDVVVLRNTFSGRGAVISLLGQEGGGLSPAPEVPTDSDPVEAALGDFNEDHAEDLVMAGWGGPNGGVISLTQGTADGLLGAISTIDDDAIGPVLGSVWAGDLNHDDHLDIAYVAPNAGGPSYQVCARLGHGDGTFGKRMEVGVPGTPVSIVGGDLNGDGNVDLVAVGYRTAVSLMGRGDGTFTIGSGFAVPPKQIIARLGDLNGDGIPDLVTASVYSNLISALFGTGDGGFGEAVCLGAGEAPGAVALDDFDGDGRLDIVAANGDDNTVSLLLNRSAGAGPLVARASRPGQGVLVIGAGQPTVCFDVKPAEAAFMVSEVDPASLYLRSGGTGSTHSIPGRSQTTSGGGQSVFDVCFTREDLAKLFDKIRQRTVVQTFLEGTLKDGRQFRADLQMTVVPARGRLSAAVAPNPSNPASVLSFATSRPGWVRVDIVDVRGRVVRTVADERSVVQGYHGYSLDGRTRSGERMASGVYYVNIRTQFDGDQDLRFVVLK